MRPRIVAVWTLTMVLTVLGVGSAWAASDSVKISGRKSVKRGHRLTVTVTASPSAATRIAVYDAPGTCARIAESEIGRNGVVQVANRAVSHAVKLKVKLPAATAGTHHVCAYLFHRVFDNLVTDARASFRYVGK